MFLKLLCFRIKRFFAKIFEVWEKIGDQKISQNIKQERAGIRVISTNNISEELRTGGKVI